MILTYVHRDIFFYDIITTGNRVITNSAIVYTLCLAILLRSYYE